LENRLRARTASVGSTLYKLTWKDRVTPAGLSIPALRASGWRGRKARPGNGYEGPFTIAVIHGSRPNCVILPISLVETLQRAESISGSGSGSALCGWTTTTTRDWKDSGADIAPRSDTGKERFDQLPRQANLAGWPTPREADGEKNVRTAEGSLREIERKGSVQDLAQGAAMTGWPTPTVGNSKGSQSFEGLSSTGQTPDGRKVAVALPHVATMTGWPIPMAGNPGKPGVYNPAGNTDSSRKTVSLLSGWPTPTALERTSGPETHQKRREFRKRNANQNTTPMYLNEAAQITVDDALCEAMGYAVAANGPIRITSTGEILTGSSAGMMAGGQLDPAHSRWLMALPPVWDDCAATAMQSMPKRRSSSSKPSAKPSTT